MLELDRVSKTYKIGTFGRTDLPAVRGVSFTLERGEVISLIGESGSGKSTIGRMILRLLDVTGGTMRLDGIDIAQIKRRQLKRYYGSVRGVFQDPFSSFNPIFKVDRIFSMIREEHFADTDRDRWQEKGGRGAGGGRAGRPSGARQVPAPALGRPAAAAARRAGAAGRDGLSRRRRDLEHARRLDAHRRPEPARRAARSRPRRAVHHARPLARQLHQRAQIILRHGAIVEMGETAKVYDNPQHPYTKMLLALVPRLHEKWRADGVGAAALAAEEGPRPLASPALVEVESGHLVAQAE